MVCLAHISPDGREQTATEHCRNTARLSGNSLADIKLDRIAYLAGLLHDMGKFKQEFQEYLQGKGGHRGSVIHSFAGCRYILERYRTTNSDDNCPGYGDITAEIIAYAIGCHHGLFDLQMDSQENGFQHRITAKGIQYGESCETFLQECADEDELDNLMDEAKMQFENCFNKLFGTFEDNNELSFCLGLLVRLISSAVIDADRSDTSAFMSGDETTTHNTTDWSACLERMEAKLQIFKNDTPIQLARAEISSQCRIFAEKPGGIYRLNAPTGAGKTLSSLRYGLAHAAKWNKSHIIFTAPLLTILEQNAAILREYIQDDSMILEHHSNVVQVEDSEDNGIQSTLADNWDAPVIITTLVQLLNTMFSGKTSCIRRFHSLANSVIIIDEVQTVPTKLLSLFNLSITFLAEICGATVVLCSATQPELQCIEHSLKTTPSDILPWQREIWEPFQRTHIENAGSCSLQDVPSFALDVLDSVDSLLVVCNKKAEAEAICLALRDSGIDCYHLSAAMCPQHRRETLNALQNSLHNHKGKTVCVSTQVIEAGVDISFGAVIRLTAGMDSVVQAAGRCNRNAETDGLAPVYILNVADENLRMLPDIKRGKDATIALLAEWTKMPEHFQNTLTSDNAIAWFYNKLYKDLDMGATEFPVSGDTLFNLLCTNIRYRNEACGYYFQQAFKTAGMLFEVFDDSSVDVIVPYGESGRALIADLCSERSKRDFGYFKQKTVEAKNYTISVYSYQRKKLEQEGCLQWVCGGSIAVLDSTCYDEILGFTMQSRKIEFLEV